MKVFYRISPSKAGYKKDKPEYINNNSCMNNYIRYFYKDRCVETILISDTKDFERGVYTEKEQSDYLKRMETNTWFFNTDSHNVSFGNGAKSFNYALDLALKIEDENEVVYFLENDYLHRPDSYKFILDGLEHLNFDIVSLYNHPDKFLHSSKGGNPLVNKDDSWTTNLYQGKQGFWMQTDSTTMTFACKVKTIRKYESIFRKHTSGTYPDDYQMFRELGSNGVKIGNPIDSQATHGETKWLAPFVDWQKYV